MSEMERHDPIALFREWFEEARQNESGDPTAFALATATPDGRPSARMVLLKGADERGFIFYTNLESRKSAELEANPWAALCFHWKAIERQVRIEGRVDPVGADEADSYFATRDRLTRIGAWASQQSQIMGNPHELEKRVAEMTLKFNLGSVPRPDFWSGYRVRPERIEFWRSKKFRLHERVLYTRGDAGWTTQRLYP